MSTKTRLWMIVTGLLCALVVLYGVLAGLLPQLQRAGQVRADAAATQVMIDAQQAQLLRLQEADRDSADLERQLSELEASIPTSPDWSKFLRELQAFEIETGVTATQITAQSGVTPEPSASELASAAGEATSSAESGVAEGATPVSSGEDVVPASNLIMIPISITVEGDAGQIAAYLNLLQTGDRLFITASIEIDSMSGASRGVILGSIYVVP